jgi:hypothetical protein
MSTAPILRIGVTGHRDVTLPPALLMQLRGALGDAFSALKLAAADLQSGTDGSLQVVSALAEGADRMVAEAGLAHGAALIAMLPFRRAVYLQDFMRLLAAAAEIVELDGLTTSIEDRNAAYSAVGEAVVATAI